MSIAVRDSNVILGAEDVETAQDTNNINENITSGDMMLIKDEDQTLHTARETAIHALSS